MFIMIIAIIAIMSFCIWKTLKEKKSTFVIWGIVISISLITLSSSIVIVDTGNKGVVLKFGALTNRILGEGLHFKMPVVDKVEMMSVQVKSYNASVAAASQDMQGVSTKVTLNYQLDPTRVGSIYRDLRKEYETRIISPVIQESMKAAIAKFTAENLINNRESVKLKSKDIMISKLEKPYGIIVKDISITDFDFSEEFNAAIEQKATAVQRAETAKRDLERIKTEQQGKIEIAKAQGESLRLQKQNVTPELVKMRQIELGEKQIEMLREKWDGVLPTVMTGNNTPFILNLKQ